MTPLRIGWQQRGTGAPVVALHGFMGDAADMAVLGPLLPGRAIVALDLPGHGPAPDPVPPGLSFDDVADAVATFLADLDGPAPTLLGYSMGGRVALGVLARHASRVASVVAIGAHPGLDAAARSARAAADRTLAARLRDARFRLEPFLDEWHAQPLFGALRAAPRYAQLRVRRRAGDPHGWADALVTYGTGQQPDLRAALAATDTRLQLLAGARDEKYIALAEALAASRKGTDARIVPDAGHAVLVEQPDAIARLLAETL